MRHGDRLSLRERGIKLIKTTKLCLGIRKDIIICGGFLVKKENGK